MNLSLVLCLFGILGFILNRKHMILMIFTISIELMLLAVTLLVLISSYAFDDIAEVIAIAGVPNQPLARYFCSIYTTDYQSATGHFSFRLNF
jgi:hypothetical protein